ncbi:MAG: permease prefix domain 1-containing protein [Phycisphaerales bacterium]|nr:permease prefix domain 1-containing protein [Phycisphaerales bacterium]
MRARLSVAITRLFRLDAAIDEEVRKDIREEIAFHVECLRDELARDGVPEEDIERRVAERFGDPDRYARACERLANRSPVMLQKVNFVMLIVILFTLAWMMHGRYNSIREQTAMLHAMQAKIDALGARSPVNSGTRVEVPVLKDLPLQGGEVRVVGSVARPGAYALPTAGTLTALRAVTVAGWTAKEQDLSGREVRIQRAGKDAGGTETVHTLDAVALAAGSIGDVELKPGDVVEVR